MNPQVRTGDILMGVSTKRVLLFLRVELRTVYFLVMEGDKFHYRVVDASVYSDPTLVSRWEELGWYAVG